MIPEPNMIFFGIIPKMDGNDPKPKVHFLLEKSWHLGLALLIKTPPRFGEFHVFLFFSVGYNLSGRVQLIWDVYQGRLGAFIS